MKWMFFRGRTCYAFLMKTELKIGMALLLVWVAVKFLINRDPEAKQIPELMESGALLVDERTAGEFVGGHIDGAVNIPYDRIVSALPDVEKDRPIIVYCQSGSRSGAAKRALVKAGYTHVVNGGSLGHMRRLLKNASQ